MTFGRRRHRCHRGRHGLRPRRTGRSTRTPGRTNRWAWADRIGTTFGRAFWPLGFGSASAIPRFLDALGRLRWSSRGATRCRAPSIRWFRPDRRFGAGARWVAVRVPVCHRRRRGNGRTSRRRRRRRGRGHRTSRHDRRAGAARQVGVGHGRGLGRARYGQSPRPAAAGGGSVIDNRVLRGQIVGGPESKLGREPVAGRQTTGRDVKVPREGAGLPSVREREPNHPPSRGLDMGAPCRLELLRAHVDLTFGHRRGDRLPERYR